MEPFKVRNKDKCFDAFVSLAGNFVGAWGRGRKIGASFRLPWLRDRGKRKPAFAASLEKQLATELCPLPPQEPPHDCLSPSPGLWPHSPLAHAEPTCLIWVTCLGRQPELSYGLQKWGLRPP